MITGGLNVSFDLEGPIQSSTEYDPVGDDSSILTTRFENHTSPIVAFLQQEDSSTRRDPLYIVLPITVIYVVIFFTGLIGNVSTCVVIARNKSMHTATNYYLFSLAISDLLLLLSGLPQEMYYIWSRFPYVFGEAFCIIQGFAAETSANATVLTITAFTVERYVAICHPIISHTMSKLSRAVKFVIVIWMLALCLAVPQAIQFGIVYEYNNGSAILDSARCSVKSILIEHAFHISTMLFFVVPMTIITVLYILIGIQLRRSRLLTATVKRNHLPAGLAHSDSGRGKSAAQRNVIHMLVAVVVAFFICWAPFHAQRLMAVYAQSTKDEPEAALVIVYTILTYVSGIFYYLSTTVNPLLYNIMSNKFREAFKSMLSNHCGRKSIPRQPTYSSLLRYPRSTIRKTDDRQNSPSISVSDDNQKMMSVGWPTMSTDLNNLPKEQVNRQVPKVSRLHGREYERSVSRGSNFSQLILMTSINKNYNEGNNNVGMSCVNECLLKIPQPPRAVTFGNLAERLRQSTKGLFSSQPKVTNNSSTKPETATTLPRLQSHPITERISSSSLQDLDETNFTNAVLTQ